MAGSLRPHPLLSRPRPPAASPPVRPVMRARACRVSLVAPPPVRGPVPPGAHEGGLPSAGFTAASDTQRTSPAQRRRNELTRGRKARAKATTVWVEIHLSRDCDEHLEVTGCKHTSKCLRPAGYFQRRSSLSCSPPVAGIIRAAQRRFRSAP